jgi:DNA repair exonuclease SbcCD ATPase subunit
MQNLIIQKLRLQNFKGIKNFTLEPGGDDVSVWGQNASGKTTLQDAFMWLLFGKDSQGKADFQLKPVDTNGQEIHKLETEVEASLLLNGKSLVLLKRFYEKYPKKKGSAKRVFQGHSTDYFIDDVPVKKKDYDSKIVEIIDINSFKLVTNPHEFNQLHWSGRRQILLEMCGDVSDLNVINSDKKLSSLSEILNSSSVDDHRAKAKAQQRKINKELEQIPVRISENKEVSKNAVKPDDKVKQELNTDLADHQEKFRSLQSNEEVSKKQIRVNEIDAEIIKLKSGADQSISKRKKPFLDVIDILETAWDKRKRILQSQKRENDNKIDDFKRQLQQDTQRVKIAKDTIENKRKEWHTENSKRPEIREVCPTCDQELPEDQIEDAKERFNKAKADTLADITAKGKESAAYIKQLSKEIKATEKEIEFLNEEQATLDGSIDHEKKEFETALAEQKEKIASIPEAGAEIPDKLTKEKADLESEIKSLKNSSQAQIDAIKKLIADLESSISSENEKKAEWKTAEKTIDRIADLEKQEKKLAAEYEKLESELYLLDKFIIQKVELLEDQINSRFKMARFKMFNVLINQGIEETCITTYNGVPWEALNSAGKIKVGLDIINALSEYYGFACTVFVDNRESCTEIIDTQAQVISLYVSPDHKELTVSNKKEKAA